MSLTLIIQICSFYYKFVLAGCYVDHIFLLTPFFNSPGVPPFRILEDEDDLGNFIEDPSMRRPVGLNSSSVPPEPIELVPRTDLRKAPASQAVFSMVRIFCNFFLVEFCSSGEVICPLSLLNCVVQAISFVLCVSIKIEIVTCLF